MKTADSLAGKTLVSAEILKVIPEQPHCFVDRLCAWLIQLSDKIVPCP